MSLDPEFDIAFYGENGTLAINGGSYSIHDLKGKQISKRSGNGGNQTHLQNFVDAIRGGKTLNAEIEEGIKSVLLCHLGNTAYRTGRTVHFDSTNRAVIGDREVKALWGREYRKGWEPRV